MLSLEPQGHTSRAITARTVLFPSLSPCLSLQTAPRPAAGTAYLPLFHWSSCRLGGRLDAPSLPRFHVALRSSDDSRKPLPLPLEPRRNQGIGIPYLVLSPSYVWMLRDMTERVLFGVGQPVPDLSRFDPALCFSRRHGALAAAAEIAQRAVRRSRHARTRFWARLCQDARDLAKQFPRGVAEPDAVRFRRPVPAYRRPPAGVRKAEIIPARCSLPLACVPCCGRIGLRSI